MDRIQQEIQIKNIVANFSVKYNIDIKIHLNKLNLTICIQEEDRMICYVIIKKNKK
jgi:hypothetical protein